MDKVKKWMGKSWRMLAVFAGLLILTAGVLTACKPQTIPTVPGNSTLTVNLTYNGAITTAGKSVLEVGLFNNDVFSEASLVATAQAGDLIAALPATGAVTFSVPSGTYYLAALNNVNGSGTFFDHSTKAFPDCGDPYITYNNISNTANSVNFSWPLSSGNKATAVNVSGSTTVSFSFGDTYIAYGLNGQPSYGGSAVSLSGVGPTGIYAVAYTNPGATTRTPDNDWGFNPATATNVSLGTIEDLGLGSTVYILVFADSGNAVNSADAGNCGGVTPCIQNGDPYTIVGPLTVGQNPKPSTGLLTVGFSDSQLWSSVPVATSTLTQTPTVTRTFTTTPTITTTFSPTITPTVTSTPTITLTPTITWTPVVSFTDTLTPTVTETPTITLTPSATPTITDTATTTTTFTPTTTSTVTLTATITMTPTITYTPGTPTVLNPGDIVITGMATSGKPDNFTIMNLVDINQGTTIYFTDQGWDASGAGSTASAQSPATFFVKTTSEGIYSWTVPTFLPKGSQTLFGSTQGGAATDSVSIDGSSVASNVVSIFGQYPIGFGGSADQLFVVQADSVNTTTGQFTNLNFVAGVNFVAGTTGWLADGSQVVVSNANSYLPTQLNAAVNSGGVTAALAITAASTSNGYYDCGLGGGTISSGTETQFQNAVNNPANWTTNNTSNYLLGFPSSCGTFTVN